MEWLDAMLAYIVLLLGCMTTKDNQEKRVKRATWRRLAHHKGIDRDGQKWEFRRYDGPTCCVIRKVITGPFYALSGPDLTKN